MGDAECEPGPPREREAAGAEPERREDDDMQLAPLASPETLECVRMEQICPGPVDYIVKCTEGLFAGRFIYVSRSAQGELFGSDKGSKDVTMYIENAELSPKHAEIKFNSQSCQYFLKDSVSTGGTWVRLRWNRSIEVASGQEVKIGQTLIEIRAGASIPPEEEVKYWLEAYQLKNLAPILAEKGFHTLNDCREKGLIVHQVLKDASESDCVTLMTALDELPKMWPASGYPAHFLEFVVRPQSGEEMPAPVASVAWAGGTICMAPNGEAEEEFGPEDLEAQGVAASRPPKEVTIGTVPVQGWEKCEWLRVGYSFGRYYVHFSERFAESTQKGWVRLRDGQQHWLQPQDFFHIGLLEFQVLRFNAGVHSEQGFRASMEDEDIVLQDLATSNWRHCSFFGVYDGHGGRDCVTFVRQRLHINIIAALHSRGGLDKSTQVHQDMHDSLVQGFRETDRQFLNMAQALEDINGGSGCAAVVACVVGSWIWCANVGDSRALLCREGKAVQLSLDHKPDREDEAERIKAAGGFVSFRRVVGRLAVSRAFGDEDYKTGTASCDGKAIVVAEPEIRVEQLTPQDDFLFMACDGLFDVFSSQEAVDFIHGRLAAMPQNEQDPQRVVQDIVHEAIHERRSRDNVTAMLATFRRAVSRRT
mmetsp:Transcript_43988/g.99390  ORF Transcript_43988/g.99390 Transcript_43988/m.99390 type:complete len:647 (+) Transcript_43988:87-2027(+)